MVVIVAQDDADRTMKLLENQGETVYRIGSIEPRKESIAPTVVF